MKKKVCFYLVLSTVFSLHGMKPDAQQDAYQKIVTLGGKLPGQTGGAKHYKFDQGGLVLSVFRNNNEIFEVKGLVDVPLGMCCVEVLYPNSYALVTMGSREMAERYIQSVKEGEALQVNFFW